MKLIKELLTTAKIAEAKIFSEVEVIKIDPDRDGPTDVGRMLLAPLVKMAYVDLEHDRLNWIKKYGNEEGFEFNQDALQDGVTTLITALCNKLESIDYGDINDEIKRVKGHFKTPLTEAVAPVLKIAKLQKAFPKVWFKDGKEFDRKHFGAIWTGEGSEIDGASAFSKHSYPETMGVHPKLAKFLEKEGLYAEFYDGGTVFIYNI